MNRKTRKKGFTLIEMLVVIAIIAVLVAIVIPVVSNVTGKARAATDAANLRSVMGLANTLLMENSTDAAATIAGLQAGNCVTFPGAKQYIYYVNPGFIIAYYEVSGAIYTVDSFVEVAANGGAPAAATLPEGGTSYPVGGSGT